MPAEIISVQNSQEVSALLAVPGSRIIAGGTSFLAQPDGPLRLVDIRSLEGLDSIRHKGNRLEIGPLTTLDALGSSMAVQAYAPALAECAASAATAEIRQRATLGGNLAADHIGDTAAALLASGAKLTIKTDSDFRDVQIDRFWTPGGRNTLEYDEWIIRITVQIPQETCWGAAFGRTKDWDLACDPEAAVAVQLSLDEKDRITAVRGGLRLGTMNIRRMFPLERTLKNRPAAEETIVKAVRAMAPLAAGYLDETEFSVFLADLVRRSVIMAKERREL